MGDFLPPGALNDAAASEMPEAGPSRSRTRHGVEYEEELDQLEEDEFQLARTYFDLREFDRVVWMLRDARGSRARFLRVYSAYLVCPVQVHQSTYKICIMDNGSQPSQQIAKRRNPYRTFSIPRKND